MKYKKLPRFADHLCEVIIKKYIEHFHPKINTHMGPGADSYSLFESSTPGKTMKGGKNGRN